MNTMTTYTGHKFDPMEITEDDIRMEDIAHALSLLCRGGGHLRSFYTVAQHSVNCAKEAKARGFSKRVQFACLLHDASEAYISDIIRPVKCHLSNYLEIENRIMQVIWKKYGLWDLNDEENRQWKQIDDEMLDYELKHLMAGEENRRIKPLFTEPDVTEQPYYKVQEEFLQWNCALGCAEAETK